MFERSKQVYLTFLIVTLSLFFYPKLGNAQVKMDSTYSKRYEDTTTIKNGETTHLRRKGISKPTIATLLSLGLPGAGQVYNGRFWKVPIIYALLGGLVSWAVDNGWKFNLWSTRYNEAFTTIKGDNYVSFKAGFTTLTDSELTNQIRVIRDGYRRDRDYAIILTSLVFALNIVDAAVDAHLKEFDVNEKIGMKIKPTLMSDGFYSMAAGLSLQIRFKSPSNSLQQAITF